MEIHNKLMPSKDWKNPKCTDNPGECFSGDNEHYYRQDKEKVLHVAPGIVNTLDANHLEQTRVNWGDKYQKIEPAVFERQLEIQLNKFFE